MVPLVVAQSHGDRDLQQPAPRQSGRAQEIAQDADLRKVAPRDFLSLGGEHVRTTGEKRSRGEQDRRANADISRWETQNFASLLTLKSSTRLLKGGRTGIVNSIAFSQDGRLISSGYDLWDARDGTRLTTLENRGFVETVAFSPDAKILVSDGKNRTIIFWDLDLASWQARAWAFLNLSLHCKGHGC